MAEFIRIAEYCKVSRLNKSKVYRAINSGIIKTKRIDGVKYIDLDDLPEAFKVDPVTRHELDTSLKAVGKPESAKPSGQVSDEHLVFFQSFCEQLEQKTSIALASQEETIKMLKNELQRKDDEVSKLKDSGSDLSSSALKELEERESRIIQLEKDFSERIESITGLETAFFKLQEKIQQLESGAPVGGEPANLEIVDTEKVQQLEAELIDTKEKLEKALRDLDEKTSQIQELGVPESERELKSKLNEQKKLVKNLELSIKKKQEKIFDLEAMLKEAPPAKEVSQQVYDFENIPDSYQDEIKRLETELDVKQSKVMKLEKELKEYKYNIPELEKESIDVQLRFSYLMNEIDDLKNSLAVQDKRLKEKDKVIASNQKLFKGKGDDSIDFERLIQEKQDKVENLEKALFDKEQKIIELEKLLVGDKPDSPFHGSFDGDDAFGDMIPEYYSESDQPSPKEQMEELKKSLIDKEEIIAKLEAMLKDKESGALSSRPVVDLPFDESQIINKIDDDEIKSIVSSKFSKILDLETILSEKENYINELEEKQKNYEENSLEEHRAKNDLIEKLETVIEEKELYIKDLKESKPESLSSEASDDELVQVLEAKLQEKDHYISELEAKLDQGLEDEDDNTSDRIESLESELQEKADYILALEKEINTATVSDDDDEAKQIIQEQLDTIENLETLLKEKEEAILSLEEDLKQKEQAIAEPEESPLETLYGSYEELSVGETTDLDIEDADYTTHIPSYDDTGLQIEELKGKVNEQEALIEELQDKLMQKDAEDIFEGSNEYFKNDEVAELKQQLDKLSQDILDKDEIISQLQAEKPTQNEFEELEPFASPVPQEDIEELKFANQQANQIIFNKDEEIQELRDQLEKEKQKLIQFASQKADEMQGSSDMKQYSSDQQGSAPSDSEKDILKAYKSQMEEALAKIRELEWQNEQMSKQLNESFANKPDDPDKSGGWMKKL